MLGMLSISMSVATKHVPRFSIVELSATRLLRINNTQPRAIWRRCIKINKFYCLKAVSTEITREPLKVFDPIPKKFCPVVVLMEASTKEFEVGVQN